MIVADITPRCAAHLVFALERERERFRHLGRPWPPELERLLWFASRAVTTGNPLAARSGQSAHVPCGCGDDDLMELSGAAAALGVSMRTLRRLRSGGSIPTVVVGGRRFVRRSSVTTFLNEQESK